MPRPCFQCVMAGLRRYGSTYAPPHNLFFGTPIIFLPARHGFPKLGPFFLLSPSQRLPSPVNVLAPTSKPRNLLATCVNQFNNTLFCLLDATPFYFFHFFLKRETDLVKIDCLVSRIFCLRSIAHQIWCIEILDQLRHEALPLSRCDTLLKNRDFIQTASIR